MKQTELVTVLAETWRQFDDAIADMDEAALIEPGVVEQWSIKDVLGHVSACELRALELAEKWRRNEVETDQGPSLVDDQNASEAARRRKWSWQQIARESTDARQRMRAMLRTIGDEDWTATVKIGEHERQLGEWVADEVGGKGPGTHAAEHAQQVMAWRQARERHNL